MKEKDKWVLEQYPRDLNFRKECSDEGFRCGAIASYKEGWLAGFNFAKEKMLDLCDSKHQIVGYAEINRLGEKPVK
jgi:hypothetical protein